MRDSSLNGILVPATSPQIATSLSSPRVADDRDKRRDGDAAATPRPA
jgi:hypothetical protein